MEGNRRQPEYRFLAYEGHKEWCSPCEMFRLRENGWISHRQLQIVGRMRQRSHVVEKVDVQASMVQAGPNPLPRKGGATKMPVHDATVTPKTALPKGVTERQHFPTAPKCRVGQSTGALTAGVELSSAPCWCAPLCAFMKRAELRETRSVGSAESGEMVGGSS